MGNELIGISVIIPVYNKEAYISKCIDSVLKQSFNNYEIIIVDDGSTDNSAHICDEYAMKYSFVHVFHIENGGLGPARNYGIQKATGEFMIFLDSDDWLRDDTLEILHNAAETSQSDAVFFDFMIYDTELDASFRSYENAQYRECNVLFEAKMYRCTLPSSCTIMYRCTTWKDSGLKFPDTPFEDNAVYPLILRIFSNYTIIDEGLYFYRTNYGKTITCDVNNDLRRTEPFEYLLKQLDLYEPLWRQDYISSIYRFCYNQLKVSLDSVRSKGDLGSYTGCVEKFNKFIGKNFEGMELFQEKKSNQIDITVIVPVHNSERYLNECLNSLRYQLFENIEILCIDDNSEDGTQSIVKNYISKDSRFKLINDDNGSYGHKINIGIDNASGRYISILESDDFYDKETLECLFMAAERNQADYVDSDFVQVRSVGNKYYYEYTSKYFDTARYDCVIYGRDNHLGLRSGTSAIWTGLYRRDFIKKNDIRLHESAGASYQDVAFRFLVGCAAKTSYHLKKGLYFYRCDNAGSSVYDNDKIMNIIGEYQYLKDELEKKGWLDKDIKAYYYFWKYTGYFWNAKRLSFEANRKFVPVFLDELERDKEKLRNCWDFFKPYICQRLIDFKNNPYEVLTEEKDREERVRLDIERKDKYAVFAQKGRTVIFGCGNYGRQVLEILSNERENICYFCDNDSQKWGQYIDGIEVVSPAVLQTQGIFMNYIIANKYHSDEINKQLSLMGIPDERICIYYV